MDVALLDWPLTIGLIAGLFVLDLAVSTLHECRHTYASLMIAAGVNAKAISTFMGHANISITLDRYGHLMPGSEDEAAELLDAYLDAQRNRAEDAARSAGARLSGEFTGESLGDEAEKPHA